MKNEEYFFTESFPDLSDCTEYYYTEFGKLEQSPGLRKSAYKKMNRLIEKSMFESIRLLVIKQSHSNSVMKIVDKDNFKAFMRQKKEEKPAGFLGKLKQRLFERKCKVDVLTSDEQHLLEDSSSQAFEILQQTKSVQNSNLSQKSNQGSNQSQTKISKQRSDSCDDEPLDF